MLWLAGDVKEPTHLSQRVGREVPGVVVWPLLSKWGLRWEMLGDISLATTLQSEGKHSIHFHIHKAQQCMQLLNKRLWCYTSQLKYVSRLDESATRVEGENSSTPQVNNNMNFRLVRDQVVLLETAGKVSFVFPLPQSFPRCSASPRETLKVSRKQNSLFPLAGVSHQVLMFRTILLHFIVRTL